MGENAIKILELVAKNKKVTTSELAEQLNISTTAVENNIKKLKRIGALRRIGPDKGGHWEIIE